MRELDFDVLKEVSGAAVTADYVNCITPSTTYYEHMDITLPNDGSLPPEFQARIDEGATWEEMAPFLTMYSIIKNTHPELFQ